MSVPPEYFRSSSANNPMDYLGQLSRTPTYGGGGVNQPQQTPNNAGVLTTDTGVGEGFNWGTFSSVLETIGNLGNLYFGLQQLDLARDQFGFAKKSFNRNLANQAQAYNTELRNTEAARLAGEGTLDRGSAEFEQALSSYTTQNRVSGAPL